MLCHNCTMGANHPCVTGQVVAGTAREAESDVEELLRSNDIVLLNVLGVMLDDAGIGHMLLDENTSVIEGSLGVLPRRVLVESARIIEARDILSAVRADREHD